MTTPARIVLVGPMGSGKSTVMGLLSARLGWIGLDTDAIVAEREGCSVAEVFARDGELMFRSLELSALEVALASPGPAVIATGGGIVETPAARNLLASERLVVLLDASPAVCLERIGDPAGRPMLGDDPVAALVRLDDRRRPLWTAVADLVVDVEHQSPEGVAEEIVARLEGAS